MTHAFYYHEQLELMWERFESGKEDEYFSQFGGWCVKNAVEYEQMLRCGYTHEQAMGVFVDGHFGRIIFDKDCHEEVVARVDKAWCLVYTFQLPNGKWVAGSHCSHQSGGHYFGCGIFSSQFDTEREARCAELRSLIESFSKERTGGSGPGPKVLIPQLKRALMDGLQINLFE